ncbi:fibroblast growth factor 19-like [Arapaima gigas]
MSPGAVAAAVASVAAVLLSVALGGAAVLCAALPPSGPQYSGGWGLSVRLRHLYATGSGLHVRIGADGRVDGSAAQGPYSLVEMRPVDTGVVVIKGVTSACYLCMDPSGKLYGSPVYVKDECCFVEHVLPNGYNLYVLEKYGLALSLHGGSVTRRQAQDRGVTSGSLFLPMVSRLPPEAEDVGRTDAEGSENRRLELDSMDPFGESSWAVVNSPSFS